MHRILQLVRDFYNNRIEKRISHKLKQIGYRRIPPPLFSWVKRVVGSITSLVIVDREVKLLRQALEQLLEYDRFDYRGIRYCRIWKEDRYEIEPAQEPVYRQRPELEDMMYRVHSRMPRRDVTDWMWGPGQYEKFKRNQAHIDRMIRERVSDHEIDYILEKIGAKQLRYRILGNMKEYLKMRDYVPDLTRAGIEPNPGPPRSQIQANPMRLTNPRRLRRNTGYDRREQFVTNSCPCELHEGVQCGIYLVMPHLKDQYGQIVITEVFCTQPGEYNGYTVYEMLYMCIQAKYEMVQQRGTRRVYRRMTPNR